jgi:hypothetical protein
MIVNRLEEYPTLLAALDKCKEAEATARLRYLCQSDLYFLIRFACGRKDMEHQWLFERCREVQSSPNGRLDLWARGHYKAVDVHEEVPTPQGWARHGDLKPGDQVFGPDGKPATVIARTPVFTDADCYRVIFCDGYRVTVSGDHLWTVNLPDKSRIPGTKQRKKWKSETLNTRDLKWHVDEAINVPSRRYPTIPAAAALQRPTRHLPLDPYVLGVWLGNGTTGHPQVTEGLHDVEEMTAHLAASGVAVRCGSIATPRR